MASIDRSMTVMMTGTMGHASEQRKHEDDRCDDSQDEQHVPAHLEAIYGLRELMELVLREPRRASLNLILGEA
jgi:hypothetical protein